MRKVQCGGANSLDNYIARRDGALDWLLWSEEAMGLMRDYWTRFDTIVMGRKTYDAALKQSPKSKKGKSKSPYGEMKTYGRVMTQFGEWCAEQGMPLSYHHHMGAVVQFERELDAFMNNSGIGIPLCFDAGHLAVAKGDVMRAIKNHHKRINHVHVKDVRNSVLSKLDWSKQSFLDAVMLGAFTVPGDGSLDFAAIVKAFADYGYEGWFVVEAEQDPKKNPPLKMAQVGHKELMRVMTAAGYSVETQGFMDV